MKATAQLTFEKVRFDAPTDVHLVVSLAAPHVDAAAPRAPVCVIPVLDVSGSMRGEKLHYARQSVLKLVDHLAPGDFCGVVVFSTQVETVAAPAEMTQARKDVLQGLVARLDARQNTNLGGGVLAGLDHARVTRLPAGMGVRVILFTDGLANEGPAKTRPELLRLLDENLGGATLSAFGYGDDADQELLRDLSTRGKGSYAHVQSPEDALTAFGRELGGLLSTYAQRLELTVTPRPGFVLTDVVSDVDATEERGAVTIRIPDLLADEVRTVVLAGRLEARPAPRGAAEAVADLAGTYEVFEEGRPARRHLRLEVPVRLVPPPEAQPLPTPAVDAVVAVAQLVRAQIDAEEAAQRGAYHQALQVMQRFQRAAAARGHGAIAAAAGKLAERVASPACFAASAGYRSSMRKGASRSVGSLYHREAAKDLEGLGQGRTTAAQDRMADAFGARSSGEPRHGSPARGSAALARRRRRW